MSAQTTTKQERITWHDWEPEGSPDPEEMTREEFLARLNAIHVDVDESDLRFWEYQGVLPRAVKRWSEGANRVFYPRWMLFTITLLRALQGLGTPLREITPHLQAATPAAIRAVRDAENEDAKEAEKAERLSWIKGYPANREHGGDDLLWRYAQGAAREALRASLDNDLKAIAKKYHAVTRKRVDRVRISFHEGSDTESKQVDYHELTIGNESV